VADKGVPFRQAGDKVAKGGSYVKKVYIGSGNGLLFLFFITPDAGNTSGS